MPISGSGFGTGTVSVTVAEETCTVDTSSRADDTIQCSLGYIPVGTHTPVVNVVGKGKTLFKFAVTKVRRTIVITPASSSSSIDNNFNLGPNI